VLEQRPDDAYKSFVDEALQRKLKKPIPKEGEVCAGLWES
jgi:hypothetical protein